MRDEKKSACKISDDQLKRFAVFYDALKVRPIAKSEVPGLVGLNDKQVDIFIFLFSLRYPLFVVAAKTINDIAAALVNAEMNKASQS